jgi:hypothetical protein
MPGPVFANRINPPENNSGSPTAACQPNIRIEVAIKILRKL